MKNSIKLLAVSALLAAGVASASDNGSSNGSISTTATGTITVGTHVGAAPGQWEAQTSTGGLSAFTVVQPGTASYDSVTGIQGGVTSTLPGAEGVETLTVVSSITGAAQSTFSGTGYTLPSFTVNGSNSSADVNVVSKTEIDEYLVPVTTIAQQNEYSYKKDGKNK